MASESSFLTKIALAGSSNMCAACFTNPIDVVKVRMQLEGELSTTALKLADRQYPGFLRGAQRVVKTEGVKGLYKGLPASLMREGSYSAIRLGLYDPMKKVMAQLTNRKEKHASPLLEKVLAGACTGAFGSALANPTDLVKIRFQADVAQPPRYPNVFAAFKTIIESQGIRGLWRGVGATTQRAAILTATQIPSYDHSKHLILKNELLTEGIQLHFVCSMFAGFVTATITSPVDVIKTRIMNAKSSETVYRGTFDALRQILATESIQGLYKGWFPNWMRIGPHTIISLMIFEQLRKLCGMPPI